MAIKIYIDQGHNPQNPNAGAEGNGLREQDIVFRIGILLADLLRANPAFEVRLSRPTEQTQVGTSNTTSLRRRVEDANAWGADYFISLHTNASEIAAATGCEAFAFSRSSCVPIVSVNIIGSNRHITLPKPSLSTSLLNVSMRPCKPGTPRSNFSFT